MTEQLYGTFRDIPEFTKIDNEIWWRVPSYRNESDYDWEVGKKNSGDWIRIEKGTIFDSSVPFFLWWYVDPSDPKFLLAALIHDEVLKLAEYSRALAASEWLQAATAAKAPKLKKKIAYVGIAFWAVFKYI